MNNITKSLLLSTTLLGANAYAGDFVAPIKEAAPTKAPTADWLSFGLNGRLRYEFRDQNTGVGDHRASQAGTIRVRPSITITPVDSLSLFAESEHTYAFIDDYQANPLNQPDFGPTDSTTRSVIGDPENNELNQLFVKYSVNQFTAKVGRQKMIFDNAAHVGNVGWRQNEQTFDAALLSYKADNFSATYAYANRVNRIFGDNSPITGLLPLEAIEGTYHFLNGTFSVAGHKFTGYVYDLDFDALFDDVTTYGGSSNFSLGGGKLYTEYAFQVNDTDGDSASYAHVNYTKKVSSYTLKGGIEYLEEGFTTPLATVHAYNGFADRFIGNRLGLGGNALPEGLTDIYGMVGTKVGGVALKGFAHYYKDDSFDQDYGWEFDFVAAKKLTENAKLVSKFAYYDGGFTTNDEILQYSLQLDFKL